MDHDKCNIAWILSSPDHLTVATSFFDEHHGHHHSVLLNMTYSTGRVGQHYVVAASRSPATKPLDMKDIVDNLQQEFPSVRAGFLVNPEATAPEKGTARVGSVVVGTRTNLQSGVIHFDTMETRQQRRLVTTFEPKHLPGAVSMAIEGTLSEKGREDWLRILEGRLTCPHPTNQSHQAGRLQLQRKVFRGVIASSTQALDDEALAERIREENGILCFDTTAAGIKSHLLVVVAGITNYTGSQQSCLPSAEVCNQVISYLSCLTRRIDTAKLGLEPPLANLYNYKPFDLERPGFRLLRLEKGSKNDPIHCQLFQSYLQEKDHREDETKDGNHKDLNSDSYEALSYCWGERPRLRNMITVDGKVLFITENLLKALENLRYDTEDRTIWIDAICIDQSNIQERGHQVGWMTKVYEHAFRVLFWLGDAGYIAGSLISLLKSFEEKVPPEAWENWPLDDPMWSVHWKLAQDGQQAYDYPSELKSLMTNPWFRRVWILQEVARARQASIGCIWGWVDAKAFAMAPALLGVQPDSQCQAIIDIMPGPSRNSSWWAQKPNISTLLWKFRESRASDPRDRLYALMGLASDWKSMGWITADYTKTQEALVREIVAFLFGDRIEPTTFSRWNIADLQRRIPNLSAIALEKMVLSGAGLEDVQEFIQRQSPTVPLSEAVVNYTWCTQSTLMHYFEASSAFQEVVPGVVPRDSDMKAIAKAAYFEERQGCVTVTPETVQALHDNGMDIAQLVSRPGRVNIKITSDLVQDIANKGPEPFKLLLNRHGSKVKITSDIIRAVKEQGGNVIQIIKDHPQDNIEITEDLIEEADQQGHNSLQLLFNKTKAAAGNEKYGERIIRLLFDQQGEKVKVTEDVLKAAAGNKENGYLIMRLLLKRRGEEFKVTEDVLKAAIENEKYGKRIIRLLLNQRGEEVKVTEDVLKAAAGNKENGYLIIRLLRDGKPRVPGGGRVFEDIEWAF
ncbi:heterokaryon incompatibility protein-domain-containing protein [Diaporthe sp. PMI_573]|nr:heterokaryon incompatibility protein-domain-containing protein [Diaporthaceae sp. PMI_573]